MIFATVVLSILPTVFAKPSSLTQSQVEVLVPDFRGRMAPALEILTATPPDVFNHNMETVPRLYREARPGPTTNGPLSCLKITKR